MVEFQEKSDILRTEQLTEGIFRLTLNAPRIAAAARPGQFVMASCGPGLDPLLRRPFSMHQVSRDGQVQILFKVVGRGTDLLARTRPGENLSLLGPLGRGFSLQTDGAICLVGGGMGIAPLLFLASRLGELSGGHRSPLVLLGAPPPVARTVRVMVRVSSSKARSACRKLSQPERATIWATVPPSRSQSTASASTKV